MVYIVLMVTMIMMLLVIFSSKKRKIYVIFLAVSSSISLVILIPYFTPNEITYDEIVNNYNSDFNEGYLLMEQENTYLAIGSYQDTNIDAFFIYSLTQPEYSQCSTALTFSNENSIHVNETEVRYWKFHCDVTPIIGKGNPIYTVLLDIGDNLDISDTLNASPYIQFEFIYKSNNYVLIIGIDSTVEKITIGDTEVSFD